MNWKSISSADTLDWLLKMNNPSVRYSTLIDLLDKPLDDPEVKKARKEIMERGIVPKILAKQKEGGFWVNATHFYIKTKYRGTVWTLLVLAELYADGNHEKVRKACEFILEHSQEESGGFSYKSAERSAKGGDHDKVLPCLTGNMVWSLLRFGLSEDPRVQKGIDWITTYQRFDDGVKAPRGWPYSHENCWGRHTCHMGVVKALKALAEIPVEKRDQKVRKTIEEGAEYLLGHHIFKRSHDLTTVSNLRWLEFGFAPMANIDVLEILDILTALGYKDERMQEAVDVVILKQNEGRWNLDTTYNGRFQVNIEQKGKPSKWITLGSLRVLKRFYSVESK